MKHNVFIIDEKPLIEAIRKYGKGGKSKDYEYAVSILMKRKLEEQDKSPYCIVFNVKPGKLDRRREFNPTPEEVEYILRNMLEEDTPVDFGLVKGTVAEHEKTAYAFQVKRVYGIPNENNDKLLLNRVHKILAKYKPGESSLVVVPLIPNGENGEKISIQVDITYLRKNIVVPAGSFLAVYILVAGGKDDIYQLWPSNYLRKFHI